MQGVTREQFHNDTEHSSRRKVRFAAEDDIQFIIASSQRAEISDLTRTVVQVRNDSAQLERECFLVPHLISSVLIFEAWANSVNKHFATRSIVQKRLSIYNWNPGPRRGKDTLQEGGISLLSRRRPNMSIMTF